MRAPPGVGAGIGEVQGRITPELRNQMQVALSGHIQGVVVAEVPVKHIQVDSAAIVEAC